MNRKLHIVLNYLIATVWLVNGLFCKVLDLVPRHQAIIGRILGDQYASIFTKAIGISEIIMATWILSGIKPRLNVIVQIFVIAIMNTIEFFCVPDLLLWGKLNALFAFIFILIIYYNEFSLDKKIPQQN